MLWVGVLNTHTAVTIPDNLVLGGLFILPSIKLPYVSQRCRFGTSLTQTSTLNTILSLRAVGNENGGSGGGTLFCNSIGCPNGFAPIDDAQTTECDAVPCEVSQCCNLFCNSIGCPDGFIPIPDAQTTLCDADPCEESQCCEAFCSFHPCSDGLIPIEDAATTLCPDSGCTDDLCCM